MFLIAKKRYVGWVYEDNPNKKKLYMTGIVLKRRDNSKIVKKVYKALLQKVLDDENIYFSQQNSMQTFT